MCRKWGCNLPLQLLVLTTERKITIPYCLFGSNQVNFLMKHTYESQDRFFVAYQSQDQFLVAYRSHKWNHITSMNTVYKYTKPYKYHNNFYRSPLPNLLDIFKGGICTKSRSERRMRRAFYKERFYVPYHCLHLKMMLSIISIQLFLELDMENMKNKMFLHINTSNNLNWDF